MLESLLFASGKGIAYDDIKNHFGDEYTEREIKTALAELKQEYSGEKGIVVIEYNDKFQFQSNPSYGERLANILQPIKEKELSKTLLQTLSIIAYRQPVTRLEIEEIRGGVSCDYAIGVLLRLNLIEVAGRRKTSPGRPALFATTEKFLKKFGLKTLEDLPDYDKLLSEVKQSDKYYENTLSLYRNDEEYNLTEEYFEEITDETPDFLKDEDIVIVE